ncbi:hypothetical protein E0Z10_g10686 [Xylaria hypoxylon]|uniref:Uncharacterized protein n=1 Tax=Xylaria hypoxylon TaxID=37992 RepID=A0A4Z0YDS4_9PEZI|nr:hypothetical protein E0Z10_g10686 [Xylaria hypoxylon]
MVSPSAKKRRREDDGEMQMPLYGPSQNISTLVDTCDAEFLQLTNIAPPTTSSSTLEAPRDFISAINNNDRYIIPSNRASASLFSVPRKAIPLPVSKKFRLVDDSHREQPNNHYLHHNDLLPSALSQPQQSHFSHAHPELASAASASPHQTRPTITRANSSALLNPCHICHRKPTKKSDLDSFADCTGCGERTCFVCLRACQGWVPASESDESSHTATEEEDLSASFTMQDNRGKRKAREAYMEKEAGAAKATAGSSAAGAVSKKGVKVTSSV